MPGERVALAGAARVRVSVELACAWPPGGRLQLVVNGHVTWDERLSDGVRNVRRRILLDVKESAWIAARFEGRRSMPGSEMPMAHTSPVYLELAGRPIFRPDAGVKLKARIPSDEEILTSGMSTEAERSTAVVWAQRARRILEERMLVRAGE
jgi:hypothetical protein